MKRFLPVLGVVCALVFACVRFEPEPNDDSGEHPLSIRDARMFFDEYKGDLRLGAGGTETRNGEEDPLAGIQPDWSKAQYSILLGKEVVEVPFEGLHVAVILNTDSTQINESSSPPPANSAVKLIAGLDDYGGIYYQVLYISATWTYLETHPVEALSVEDLDNGFSGIVKFYEIGGEFTGGIVVNNSQQVGTIQGDGQELPWEFAMPQNSTTRGLAFDDGGSNCNFVYTDQWICWNEHLDDPGMNENGEYDIGATIVVCSKMKAADLVCTGNQGGGSGGTGPGGSPGGTGPVLDDMGDPKEEEEQDEEEENPCETMNEMLTDEGFGNILNIFRDTLVTKNYEVGITFNRDETEGFTWGYEFFSDIGGSSINWNVDAHIDGFIHSHYSGLLKIFSPDDLFSIYDLYISGNIVDYKTFSLLLVVPGGNTYLLFINDLNKFIEWGRPWAGDLGQRLFRDIYRKTFGITESLTANDSELMFLRFLHATQTGLSLKKIDSNNEVSSLTLGEDEKTDETITVSNPCN